MTQGRRRVMALKTWTQRDIDPVVTLDGMIEVPFELGIDDATLRGKVTLPPARLAKALRMLGWQVTPPESKAEQQP